MSRTRSPVAITLTVQTTILDTACPGYVAGTPNVVTVRTTDWGKTIVSTGTGSKNLTINLPDTPPAKGTWLRVLNAVDYTLIVTTVSTSAIIVADGLTNAATCTWDDAGHLIGACAFIISLGTTYFVANQSSAAIVMDVGPGV